MRPKIMTEDETIDRVLLGGSLARLGDGELRLAVGGKAASQRADVFLQRELIKIMVQSSPCLVGVPNFLADGPNRKNWEAYGDGSPKYGHLYRQREYASAFVTRPDSAPWINREDYWDKIATCWRGLDVCLVIGDNRSLTADRLAKTAKSVREVWGTRHDAYDVIDELEAKIGDHQGIVILCLGATATVLAWRLSKKGLWAVDLGHVGMFLRRLETTGSYKPRHEVIALKVDA